MRVCARCSYMLLRFAVRGFAVCGLWFVFGVARRRQVLQHDEQAWQHLCDDLFEEFGARPLPHDEIDAVWESEEAARREMEQAAIELAEAEAEAQRKAKLEEQIRERAAAARAKAERERKEREEVRSGIDT